METSTTVTTLLEILKYTLPSIVVLVAAYLIVNRFLTAEFQRKQMAIFNDNLKVTVPMRLQAYERLAIFLNRINPMQLATQFYNSSATVVDVQLGMIQNIRTEFEYNLSQQIYVSFEVWQAVVTAKEQEIAMVNGIASRMPQTASAKDFITALNQFLIENEEDTPSKVALEIVNKEAKMVLLA